MGFEDNGTNEMIYKWARRQSRFVGETASEAMCTM